MAFILSTATVVSSPFQNAVSVNTGVNTQQQLLFQLSNSNPVYDTLINYQTTVNISVYSPGPKYNTIQSVDCKASNTLRVKVTPGFCGKSLPSLVIDDEFYVNNYSYSKDRNTHGTESWSLISKNRVLDDTGKLQYESEMFRGISTGTSTGGAKNTTGTVFSGNLTKSSQMSVQAGFPGVGSANEIFFGRVVAVGGGIGEGDSEGQASVSIPYVEVPNDGKILRTPKGSLKTIK